MQSFKQAVQAARVRQAHAAKKETQRNAKRLDKLTNQNAGKLKLIEGFTRLMINDGFRGDCDIRLERSLLTESLWLHFSPCPSPNWEVSVGECRQRSPLYTIEGLILLKSVSAKDVARALAETAASKGGPLTDADFLF